MRTWHEKASDIIEEYCRQSYLQANTLPNGKRRKRHVPYAVPEIAAALVAALNANDEHEAKRLFMIERTGAWSLI
jgi:hypothetical protein